MLGRDGPARPSGLNVASEHLQHLAKGQVRVADAGVGVALPAGYNQVSVRRHRPPGELANQHGLAAARIAGDEGHSALAGQRQVKEAVQFCQFPRPSNKWCRGAGERGSGGGNHSSAQEAVANLLVQRGGLVRRLNPQFLGQQAPTGLILGQGGAAPAAQRQQAHQLPVGFLVPGLQGQ